MILCQVAVAVAVAVVRRLHELQGQPHTAKANRRLSDSRRPQVVRPPPQPPGEGRGAPGARGLACGVRAPSPCPSTGDPDHPFPKPPPFMTTVGDAHGQTERLETEGRLAYLLVTQNPYPLSTLPFCVAQIA